MASIKKSGPYNPQKATAYVGKKVLQNGDTIPAIKGSISPVPNGPLIQKKGPFKGSGLKNGGSTSQHGLWDSIRENKGSGKKPTTQMIKQEKKIKAKTKK